MAKRYLTDQQKLRIKHNQEKRVQHLQEATKSDVGLLVAHYGAYVDVEAPGGKIRRCQLRQSLPTLVVGDQVAWQATSSDEGVVIAQLPRRSMLYRPDSRGQIKPVAANVDQIIIVFSAQPMFSELLLDGYLIAAELNQIKPVIVLNKMDLVHAEEEKVWKERLKIYEELDYPVLFVSSKLNKLAELGQMMHDKVSVFVGQSGVGKSSLIQHLVPHLAIAVGEISDATQLGRHTTTTSRLYHLAHGGAVIDSPGVREFGLGKINYQQLVEGFIELKVYQGLCKFRDCQHDKEPGCAFLEAVKENKISVSRFNNFKKLMGQVNK